MYLMKIKEQCVIMTKYEGYIEKQLKQIDQFKKLENKRLPEVIDYLSIDGLRIEARQKLDAIRPISIGQASLYLWSFTCRYISTSYILRTNEKIQRRKR